MSSKQGFYSRLNVTPNMLRMFMNIWPPFLGMRIHIERIAPDWRSVRVRMKLSLRNKNYVGTHFGGALFSMTDPFYMLMLMNLLGKDYLVWDQSSNITFIAPGRGTVFAQFEVTPAMLDDIAANTQNAEKYLPTYAVTVVDEQNKPVAEIKKTLYIRRRARDANS
jgi:acyl-coenzyme A thioesterase PaaI-like protein